MSIPSSVKRAATLWTAAVAAGVIESILVIVQAAGEGPLGAGIWAGVAVRVVVYTLAMALIINLWKGRRWARIGLTVLLAIIGLASLIVPAAVAMFDGQSFVQAFSDGGALGWPFFAVRLTHIACVVSASVLMFTTSANRYFSSRATQPSAKS
jgi:hypothetical protein